MEEVREVREVRVEFQDIIDNLLEENKNLSYQLAVAQATIKALQADKEKDNGENN